MTRYARQMILLEVGAEGQAKLAAAHVLVVGAGGLGCPVLQYLTGAGIGQITLIDPDHVEESNLHRQPLYTMSDIGRPKVVAACRHLAERNPDPQITPIHAPLTPGNAPDLVRTADIVIDAADSFAVSYILSDTCRATAKPLVVASALGQSGYVGAFCGGAPSLRAVFPDLPERGATCATAGVLGPAVGAIGAIQAQIALRLLLGADPSPLGQMVTVDLANLHFGSFGFLGTPEPEASAPFLSLADICETDRVLELRTEAEAAAPLVANAERISPEAIQGLRPDPDQRVVLCCQSGLRAWRAATQLRQNGHQDVALVAALAFD